MEKIKGIIYWVVFVFCYICEVTSKFAFVLKEDIAEWAGIEDRDYL